jgi:hypothetical protein
MDSDERRNKAHSPYARMKNLLPRSPNNRRASVSKCGGRIVSLLLAASLVADPAVAAATALNNPLAPIGGEGVRVRGDIYWEQALALGAAGQDRPLPGPEAESTVVHMIEGTPAGPAATSYAALTPTEKEVFSGERDPIDPRSEVREILAAFRLHRISRVDARTKLGELGVHDPGVVNAYLTRAAAETAMSNDFSSEDRLGSLLPAQSGRYAAVWYGEFVVTDFYRSAPIAITTIAGAGVVVAIYDPIHRVGALAHFEHDRTYIDESIRRLLAALDEAGADMSQLKVRMLRNPRWPAYPDREHDRKVLELMGQMAEQSGDLTATQNINDQLEHLVGPNDVFNQIENSLRRELTHRHVRFTMETYFEDDDSTIALHTEDGSVYPLKSEECGDGTPVDAALRNAIRGYIGRTTRRHLQGAENAPLFQRPSPPENSAPSKPAAPAGMIWGTPAAQKTFAASNAYHEATKEHERLFSRYRELVREGNKDKAVMIGLQIAAASTRRLNAERTMRNALGTEAPEKEQPHFDPVFDLLMQLIARGMFPTTEKDFKELMRHDIIIERLSTWVNDHAQDGHGRVFDLKELVFVAFEEALHRLPLITLHTNVIRAMRNDLKSFNEIAQRAPLGTRAALVKEHYASLKPLTNFRGIEAHRNWNSDPTNGIAGMQNGLSRRTALQTGLTGLLKGWMTPEVAAQVSKLPAAKLRVDLSGDAFQALGAVIGPLKSAFDLLAGGISGTTDIIVTAGERLYPLVGALEEWRYNHSKAGSPDVEQSLMSILDGFVKFRIGQLRQLATSSQNKSLRDLYLAAVSDESDAYSFDVRWGLERLAPAMRSLGIEIDIEKAFEADGLAREEGYARIGSVQVEGRKYDHGSWLSNRLTPLIEKAVTQFVHESGLIEQPEYRVGHGNLNAENIVKTAVSKVLKSLGDQLNKPTDIVIGSFGDVIRSAALDRWEGTVGNKIEFELRHSLYGKTLPLTIDDFTLWLTDRGRYVERRKRQFQLARWTDRISSWRRNNKIPVADEARLVKALDRVPQELMENMDEEAMKGVLRGIAEKGDYEKPDYSRPALAVGPSLHDYTSQLIRLVRVAARTSDLALTIFLDRDGRLLQVRWAASQWGSRSTWCPPTILTGLRAFNWPGIWMKSSEDYYRSRPDVQRYMLMIPQGISIPNLRDLLGSYRLTWSWHDLTAERRGFQLPAPIEKSMHGVKESA